MNLLNRLLENLRAAFFTDKGYQEKAKKKKSPIRTLALLLLCGVALMLVSHFTTGRSADEKAASSEVLSNQSKPQKLSAINSKLDKNKHFSSMGEYEKYYSDQLRSILEQINGVSDVSVMVTLASSEKNIYQENEKRQTNRTKETDRNGGTRVVNETNEDGEVVTVENGQEKKPVIIGKEKPEIRGVLVVAQGAESPTVKASIMEAVSTVLDIPDYKVQVLPRKSKGDY
ncbi:stage III sporulation protein AG [Scopulibacillus daqui]|uniref:Stage III sporulation protein AG n=1 Tax=Scopulibacillus daqui TaxID=1469162 RepID=A0ABS2Q2I0_9BACL|nr:stage III sporulation protein AG [Scopulibacillus daqui]MBM7646326.1 stage III sporulation protein AG [Scopulibacillus daqui]